MEIIKSKSNNNIQFLKRVISKREKGLFVFEGRHIILEAVSKGFPVKHIYLREDIRDTIEVGSPNFIIEKTLFNKISPTKSSEGIIAIGQEKWEKEWNPNLKTKALLLEGIQDPTNVGILIRSAYAFGFTNVILDKKSCSPYNFKAIMRSGGSIFGIRLFKNEARKTLETCINLKLPVFASYPKTKGNLNCPFNSLEGCLLALGNEGKGLSTCWNDSHITHITIPMRKESESLNVSVAGSLLMFLLSEFKQVQAFS